MRSLPSRRSMGGAAVIAGAVLLPTGSTAAQIGAESTPTDEVIGEEAQLDRGANSDESSQRARANWQQSI